MHLLHIASWPRRWRVSSRRNTRSGRPPLRSTRARPASPTSAARSEGEEMLDSGVLGVVIGLILIYFLLSLVCSGLNELMEAFLRRRSKYLEGAIVDLLGLDLKRQLYEHPLLETLYPQKGKPEADEA